MSLIVASVSSPKIVSRVSVAFFPAVRISSVPV
jgi:hypothetical protein